MPSKTDLIGNTLCLKAQELGASRSRAFPAQEVVVDPRVLLKCKVPVCRSYGTTMACPPHAMSPGEFQETLKRYEQAILIQLDVPMSQAALKETFPQKSLADLVKNDRYRQLFIPGLLKLHDIASKVEAAAFGLGCRFATTLAKGPCVLCEDCPPVQSGKTCRHPFQARPSMEAVGIDVFETARRAGLPIQVPAVDLVVRNALVLVS